jgi:hypothetical protein
MGVQLTFICSTNLDTIWSWQQIQLEGNVKTSAFFRSNNCLTTGKQEMYNNYDWEGPAPPPTNDPRA